MVRGPLALLILGVGVNAHSWRPGDESSGLNAMAREFFGGSTLRNFMALFSEPLPEMIIGSAAGQVIQGSDGVYEQTFVSPPMNMARGHVTNRWLPIDWPNGHIAVKAFSAEVVKAGPDNEIPPPITCCGGDDHVATRDEVFMHHWTVNKWQLPADMFKDIVKKGGLEYNLTLSNRIGWIEWFAGSGLNSGANGPCYDSALHLFFGIGNEVRSKTLDGRDAYEFPDPYGLEFDSAIMRNRGEFMVLNTHLIDIRNVNDRRACEECKCSEMGVEGYLNNEGGLHCCHSTVIDGGKCKLKPGYAMNNATYYIRYTVKWREFDPATTKALEVITFDGTDNNTKWGDFGFLPGGFNETHEALNNDPLSKKTIWDGRSGDFENWASCHIEYYVPKCEQGESCGHRVMNSWQMPYPIEIIFLRNHLHAGGVNMTTRGGSYSCTGNTTYDDGNLVDITTCVLGRGEQKAIQRIERGESLIIEAHYLKDELPHYGVMAMSFVYAHIPSVEPLQV